MSIRARIFSTLSRRFLILWSFAILWLYVGSLVNFHQHRIFGHQLLPATVAGSRVKDKDGLKSISKQAYTVFSFNFINEQPASPASCILSVTGFSLLPASDVPASSGAFARALLRAPPVVA